MINVSDKIKRCEKYTRLRAILQSMKYRCYNKKHKHNEYYGGKGITICDEWKNNIKAFYDWSMENGYEDSLTLDRINNKGNYEPSNCRWVTRKQQMRNTKRNHLITYNGRTQCLTDWAIEYNIDPKTLDSRINKLHWNMDKALCLEHKPYVKSVVCVETGEKFNSIIEASGKLNICDSNIASVCKGKRKTAGGHHWKYI